MLKQIRQEVMQSLGEQDAKLSTKYVILFVIPKSHRVHVDVWWLDSTCMANRYKLLGISKIVENMELGHNVMHGQFDWLNEPSLNGNTYDWDTIASGDDWRETHNYVHHTYTNIVGKDHDVGYGLLRVSDQQKWEPRHLFNIPLGLQLMFFFEWYVGVQTYIS